ncbi:nickel ABC transporter substrate-binding protein [Bacillus sp. SW14]|uniref:nickel ABC transporter substrate-binding protein n=1 Tax=Bacillus sp. SW14 TaxID=3391618 RepID=UPI0039E5781E
MRKRWQMCCLLAVFLFASGCSMTEGSSDNKENEKSINLLFNFPANTLDPHIDTNYTAVRAGVAETLVKIDDEDLKIKPWLAEKWESKDGKTWTFTLKENLTFQNGKKADAEAVKKSLERAIGENEAIQNALHIESMKANNRQLVIKTDKVRPEFPSELVHPNTAIIDVADKNEAKAPVGTGPFKVESFTSGSSLSLIKFEDYWDGAAKLDKAVFSFNEDANARLLAIKSGDVDIAYRPPIESLSELEAQGNIQIDSIAGLRTHQLTFNLANPLIQDIQVRKAINALIDKDEIATSILENHGEVARGPFLKSFPFSPDYETEKSGIEAAKKYLKEAGYQKENGILQKDGKTLSFTLLTYQSRPELPLIAQLIQSNAKKLGITIDIQQVENVDEYMAEHHDWGLATYSSLTAPRGDAGYFLNAAYHEKGALNYGQVNDAKLNGILDELNQTVDIPRRESLAKEAAEIIDEKVLNSFMVHPNIIVAYNKERVKNWKTTRSEYYMLTNELEVK